MHQLGEHHDAPCHSCLMAWLGDILHLLGEHSDAPCHSCLMALLGERFTPVGGTQRRVSWFVSDDVVQGTFYTGRGNTMTRLVIDVCMMTFLRDLARE